jgi:hypothetical protein
LFFFFFEKKTENIKGGGMTPTTSAVASAESAVPMQPQLKLIIKGPQVLKQQTQNNLKFHIFCFFFQAMQPGTWPRPQTTTEDNVEQRKRVMRNWRTVCSVFFFFFFFLFSLYF